ncbi:hypothetical protein [Lactobacillus selangorensis]|nr:hypothetical protein [Lactobacillus selangorensis]KRN31391.1 hypothetical protein IV40_GL001386 [Lactobacillus selangorensis]
MKTSQKVMIGLGITTALGATGVYFATRSIVAKVQKRQKRQKVRRFVDEKFHGNDKALALVDQLSDEDVDHLLNFSDHLSDLWDQISGYSSNLQDLASDLRDQAIDKLQK